MPGIFFFDEFWEKTKNFNKKKIAEKFIDDYRRFFNSKIM